MVYNIIEVANTHGGNLDYLKSLIKEFSVFKKNFGIKFQVLKPDEIAVKDYEWYGVYERVFFSSEQWKKIIFLAKETKDVWIDVFDKYSVQIIKENLDKIDGLKFQASVLNNYPLFNELSKVDLSNIKVILNIAGHSIRQIKEIVKRVENELFPKEIILQVGFQDYPTELVDSGIGKIQEIKQMSGKKIAFADHSDGKTDDALFLPVLATMLGADILEKHVMHSVFETKYDHFSSLTPVRYKKYLELQDKYLAAYDKEFITEKEAGYLRKSIQIPILNKNLQAGQIPSLRNDFVFKRANMEGINVYEIKDAIESKNVLSSNKNSGQTLKTEDFKKAKIATIIACRMKSSRLPNKAILKIGELSSVELCVKNALRFQNVDHTILATSYLDEDEILKEHIYNDSVIFHRGDPEDVIKRYLGIIDKMKIDVVVRVTADMPYVSNDILQILLKSHFDNGADYTSGKEAAVGTNLEIINSSALWKIKKYFPNAKYSEYMTFYFKNNPSYFKLNYVELPTELVRDYRLTLDYPVDLEMFNEIEEYFRKTHTDFNLKELFKFLDNNPDVANINKDLTLRYKTDQELIRTLNKATTIR